MTVLDVGLTAFRRRLAATLPTVDGRAGVAAYPAPPAQPTAPCYIVHPEAGYAIGRLTACVAPVAITVRCVPAATENDDRYDELDDMVEAVYRLPGTAVVSAVVGAREVAGLGLVVVADVDVSASVELSHP